MLIKSIIGKNTVKRFFTLTVAMVTAIASSSLTSCKDYDEDISNLQTQVNDLKTLVADLRSKIESGSVITSVDPISNGIAITLSDGNTYSVTNGKDGAKGEKGDKGDKGDIGEKGDTGAKGDKGDTGAKGDKGDAGNDGVSYTIGQDGYWYANGTRTDYRAIGIDGHVGEGGDYYVPDAATGKFVKYEWDVASNSYKRTPTNISFLAPGTVTAVMDDTTLTLYGVTDANGKTVGGTKGIVISLGGSPTNAELITSDGFYFGTQLDFNNIQTVAGVFGQGETDSPIRFQGGMQGGTASVLVKVNPSNAILKADNVKLVNTAGKVCDIVECTSVNRYTSITTRAAQSNLWVVTFRLKDGVDADTYHQAAGDKGKQPIYAVGIHDEKSTDPDALVTTGYDLTLQTSTEAYHGSFTVNGTTVDGKSKLPVATVTEGDEIRIAYPYAAQVRALYVMAEGVSGSSGTADPSAYRFGNAGVREASGSVIRKAKMFSGGEAIISVTDLNRDSTSVVTFRAYAVNQDGTAVTDGGTRFTINVKRR